MAVNEIFETNLSVYRNMTVYSTWDLHLFSEHIELGAGEVSASLSRVKTFIAESGYINSLHI